MTKKIIFSTGGTGGHIFPAVNLMKHFLEKNYKIILITDFRGYNFVKNYLQFKTYIIKTQTPTNKNFIKKILSFFIIFYSIFKSFIILKKEKPDLVFGCGGYVSFPISFASRFLNLPLIIYENNMVVGRANKSLLSFAKKILIAKKISINFPEKYKHKTYEVGPILDKNIINNPISNKIFNKEKFSILVLGGSQGAEMFGEIIPSTIKMLNEQGFKIKIIQQCIENQNNSLIEFYKKNKIENYIFNFEKDIFKYMKSSDIAITRCGASATAELTQLITPFIAVPIPNSIDNHQYLNAKYYENKECCWLLEQKNFNVNSLFNLIVKIIKNTDELENIKKNMKKNYNKKVYENIENEIKELIKL
jgi:UDP-N-acetylglucosamine--N-acetylmuramyl-(pentapeptide) pyrophosphoryl-undecaprenol N-acetylglucosamine transferase